MKNLDKAKMALKESQMIQVPPIQSPIDYKRAADSVKFLRDKYKELETLRKEETMPLLSKKKTIDSEYNTFLKPIDAIMSAVKGKMKTYYRHTQKEQAKLETKAVQEAGDKDMVIVDDLVENLKEGEFSKSNVKTVTKYRIKDEDMREFITVKQTYARSFFKGRKTPEWIESYEEESITIRSV